MQAFTHKSGWHGAPVRNMPGKVLAEERGMPLLPLEAYLGNGKATTGNSAKELGNVTRPPPL